MEATNRKAMREVRLEKETSKNDNRADKPEFSKGLELAMFLKVWKALQVFDRAEKSSNKTYTATNKNKDKLKSNDKRKEMHFQKISLEEKEMTKCKSNAIIKGIKSSEISI